MLDFMIQVDKISSTESKILFSLSEDLPSIHALCPWQRIMSAQLSVLSFGISFFLEQSHLVTLNCAHKLKGILSFLVQNRIHFF
jgi:hypothetical protein